MKKVFRLQNLDCATCAERLAAAIEKIDGVQTASVNFMAQRMVVEAEYDDGDLVEKIKAVMKKTTPDCRIIFPKV